jgi:hypothetical protein
MERGSTSFRCWDEDWRFVTIAAASKLVGLMGSTPRVGEFVREKTGGTPSLAIIDSQSAKTALKRDGGLRRRQPLY